PHLRVRELELQDVADRLAHLVEQRTRGETGKRAQLEPPEAAADDADHRCPSCLWRAAASAPDLPGLLTERGAGVSSEVRTQSGGVFMNFAGNMVALVTPFRNGAVDWSALEALVEAQIVGQVAAL